MTCIRAVMGLLSVAAFLTASPSLAAGTHYEQRTEYHAPHAAMAPTVDGVADESIWAKARWQELDQNWLGPEYTAEDFQGRYKVV